MGSKNSIAVPWAVRYRNEPHIFILDATMSRKLKPCIIKVLRPICPRITYFNAFPRSNRLNLIVIREPAAMIGFKGNFILSIALHTVIIAAFFISVCVGIEIHVPKKIVVVSLLEEKRSTKAALRPLSHVRQRQGATSPEEPSSQGNILGEVENSISLSHVKKENTSEGKGESMSIYVDREAGLSNVLTGPEIATSLGYSHVKIKRDGSGMRSQEDPYSLIRAAISRAKIYPLLARKRKIEGTVVTGFSINKKGRPQDLKIEKSSGYEILDAAALRIVTKAAPFPRANGEVIVPITFKLTESPTSN